MITLLLWARLGFLALLASLVALYFWTAFSESEQQ